MQGLANTLVCSRALFLFLSCNICAFGQARAFRESFPTGLAFITKITTNAKSLGTLTTVAATQCPMIFSTKGDKCAEFKELEPDLFARLLIPKEEHKTPEFAYTFRRMHSYFKKVCRHEPHVLRGPKLLVDIPTMKLYIHIMDSMTSEELDTSSVTSERLIQISMQAEVTMVQARKMMTTYKRMATAWMKLEDVLRKLS
uniref:Signal recognition particle SRP54 subunit M-domain domain-containing protein n=1 Tax=Brassica oleracea TaxID=3712 RepID=A0A3P6DXW8_BRAOL|nr:unnamed protein product [Brassica oleracea]